MTFGSWYGRHGDPIRRLAQVACAIALCWTSSSHADTATLSVGDGSGVASSNQPGTIMFPATRGGSQAYDTVLGYHAVDASAVGGADYLVPPGTLKIPAAATSVQVPVALNPDTRSGSSVSFHLQLDNASRIGPAPSFATPSSFATGLGPPSVTTADINGDGKPDLITAKIGRAHV